MTLVLAYDCAVSGLGLALVAAVAKRHGAKIRLENAAPGLRVVVRFKRFEQA